MQPLKVMFHLGSPITVNSERPLHLDALLAAAVSKEMEALGSENPWAQAEDLSSYLGRTEPDADGQWVWQASALHFDPVERFDALFVSANMVRKSDPDRYYDDLSAGYWGSDRALNLQTYKIDTMSGQQRGYQWVAQAKLFRSATAWAIGDIDGLRDALGQIGHIGKLGRNGNGRITHVSVEPCAPEDRDNWKLRTLPKGYPGKSGVDYAAVHANLRAPYWRQIDRVEAQEPITLDLSSI